MHKTPQRYLVRAEVVGGELLAAVGDQALVGETVRRRINRLERAAETCRGKVVHRSGQRVLASFDSAVAAVLGACEMQKRCAVIPQISGLRLHVRIGIHLSYTDRIPSSGSPVEEVSTELADLLDDDGVVVSGRVHSTLSLAQRQAARRIGEVRGGLPAYAIDWQRAAGLANPAASNADDGRMAGGSAWPAIVLRHGGRELRLAGEQRVVTVGRDACNDIVVDDRKASRSHCRITRHLDSYVLVDVSTNGTYVTPSDGRALKVRHELLPLRGRGWITLGIPYRRNLLHRIEFEVRAG